MSRRLLLAAAVVVPAALLPATASAAPERGFLVVEGQGGTTTEWELTGQTALLTGSLPDISGGGPYAGVLIEGAGGSRVDRTGAVQVRAFGDRTKDVVAPLAVDNQLEPGRYTVTLLGQGPVRVRYALADREREGLHVVPRTRLKVTFLGRAERIDFGQSAARVELPGTVPAGRRVVQVALLDGTGADDLQLCATSGSSCDAGARRPRVGTGSPQAFAQVVEAATAPRGLLWSVNGYRGEIDRLRAAAIVF